jgi:hypothetical protein
VSDRQSSGSTPKGNFERWLDAFESAYQNPQAVSAVACPACGHQALTMVFVVEEAGETRAIVAFWCNDCLRGLPANTTVVPQGTQAVVRGTESIPNYDLVPDDA